MSRPPVPCPWPGCGAIAGERCRSPSTGKVCAEHSVRKADARAHGRDPAADWAAIPEYQRDVARFALTHTVRVGAHLAFGDSVPKVGKRALPRRLIESLERFGAMAVVANPTRWEPTDHGRAMLAAGGAS